MYTANENRYDTMKYRRCGESGLMLPEISLGLWHNFSEDNLENNKEMVFTSFDNGITHFDLANNYGTTPGAAECCFGSILKLMGNYRDQIIITTKAGHKMWDGPYGDWGSRKSIMASINQSLKRLNTEYVDIFYSHRYDPCTPLEETMTALADIVKQGKSLYIGLSKYPDKQLRQAYTILKELKIPVITHQIRYSMLVRDTESTIDTDHQLGLGTITFSPLAGGMLSSRYLNGIPTGSRASSNSPFLSKETVIQNYNKILQLNDIAIKREQTLSQMAIAWQLNNTRITSVLCGASNSKQIKENLSALKNTTFTDQEISKINDITKL